MHKSIGTVLTASLLMAQSFMTFGVYAATPFDNDQEFVNAFSWMSTNGYTSTTTTDAFRPADTLTRQEAARFIAKFGTEVLCRKDVTTANYSDASTFDPTLASFINKSTTIGMLK